MSLCLLCALLSLAAGGWFGVDWTLFREPQTSFTVLGSVWWRYAGLALLIAVLALLSLAAGRTARGQQTRPGGSRFLRLGFGLQAAGFFAGGVLQAAGALGVLVGRGKTGAETLWSLVLSVFFLIGGVWALNCAAGSGRGVPASTLPLGAFADIGLFLLCLKRFITAPTSIARVMPTLDIFEAMAAMLLVCALLRALYLPAEKSAAQRLFFFGSAGFLFCFCLPAAKLVSRLLTAQHSSFAADLPVLGAGLLGLTVAVCVQRDPRAASPEQ